MRILLIEDDPLLGKGTRVGLEQDGLVVDWVLNASQAEAAALTHAYAAILLDLGLPDMDGMQLLRRLRQQGHEGPILVVTARSQVPERIAALDAGADDFIIKPFDLDELHARLRATVRRSAGRSKAERFIGDIRIDPARRSVSRAGEEVSLTVKEFALLLALSERPGDVLSRDRLEEALYGWGEEVGSNAIEVHVHHLRRKLGRRLIQTVHGVGYSLQVAP